MNKSDLVRLAKGVLIGGPLVVVACVSFTLALAYAIGDLSQNLLFVIIALSVFVLSLIGSLCFTGFWGRWGLLVFFPLAPFIILVDHAFNPLYPAGTVLIAILFMSLPARLKS